MLLDKRVELRYKVRSQVSSVLEPLSMWAGYVLRHYCLAAYAHILRGFVMPSKLTNAIVDTRLIGRNIRRISDYLGMRSPMTVECVIDGYRWDTTPDSVLSAKTGCRKCAGTAALTNDEIDRRLANRPIRRVGKYVSAKIKIEFACSKESCGFRWFAAPDDVLHGKGCQRCAKNERLTNEIIDKRLENTSIVRVGDCVSAKVKIEFLCKICGNSWSAQPQHVMTVSGCVTCAVSGFDPNQDAVVYVYRIDDEYCGYGITGNLSKRDRQHRASFRKHATQAELIATYECSGHQAQDIENLLKKTFEVVDTGIAGFRKEATHLSNLPRVLDFINNMLDTTPNLCDNTAS